MLKLLNFSVDPWDLDKFGNNADRMEAFLDRHGIAGFEMIQYANWDDCAVPKSRIVAAHSCFWPSWLDFWREDRDSLMRQFGDEATCREYYGFDSKSELVGYYRQSLDRAQAAGVKYVVFHVSHAEMEHAYTYGFPYGDEEITDAFIDMMNEIVGGSIYDFDIVFENHWYPGLTLLDRGVAEKLINGFKHPRKGFVLDIGHMMNTDLELTSESEAADYIADKLKSLGSLARMIKVVHLNSSLTGEYVRQVIKEESAYNPTLDFKTRHSLLYKHISMIDTHQPFMDPSIRRVIELASPDYLVYEFCVETLPELEHCVMSQNGVMDGIS